MWRWSGELHNKRPEGSEVNHHQLYSQNRYIYIDLRVCTNICVTVDVSQAILLLFNSRSNRATVSLRSSMYRHFTRRRVPVDLPDSPAAKRNRRPPRFACRPQGSHAATSLLLTTNLSVSGSVALVLPHVLVLVRCRASISRVQSKA